MIGKFNSSNIIFEKTVQNLKSHPLNINIVRGKDFEVSLYKKSKDKFTKRIITQNTKQGIKKVTDYIKNDKSFRITRLNGSITQFSKQKIFPDNYFVNVIKDFINNQEIHQITHCKKGKIPKEILYVISWDGEAPKLVLKNIETKDTIPNLEFLPVCLDSKSKKAIEHLSKNQIKNQGLNSLNIPLAKITSIEKLLKSEPNLAIYQNCHDKPIKGITDTHTAQVYIINKQDNVFDLIDTVVHEYQHIKDIVDIERLDINLCRPKEGYKENALALGVIKSDAPEYSLLCKMRDECRNYLQNCSNNNHDSMIIEDRAIKKASNVVNKVKLMLEKISILLEL